MSHRKSLVQDTHKSQPRKVLKEKPKSREQTTDAITESPSKSTSLTASSKQNLTRKSTNESTQDWSNENVEDNNNNNNNNNRDNTNAAPPVLRQSNRRAQQEIIATDIPTILMEDADGESTIDMKSEIAVAPLFSVNQIAVYKDIEKDFARQRRSQYIDPKIDISILYQGLHLQEEFDDEELKPWDWDKTFVEIQNAISNPVLKR